jgi:hypothetical protein
MTRAAVPRFPERPESRAFPKTSATASVDQEGCAFEALAVFLKTPRGPNSISVMASDGKIS